LVGFVDSENYVLGVKGDVGFDVFITIFNDTSVVFYRSKFEHSCEEEEQKYTDEA
jgi:hypothetical protein